MKHKTIGVILGTLSFGLIDMGLWVSDADLALKIGITGAH